MKQVRGRFLLRLLACSFLTAVAWLGTHNMLTITVFSSLLKGSLSFFAGEAGYGTSDEGDV